MGAHAATNVRFWNNIVLADKYRQVNGKELPGVVYDYNLYFPNDQIYAKGPHDLVADPLFLVPSINRRDGNFGLQPGSPALHSGGKEKFSPAFDKDGKPRGDKPSRGAYQ